MRPSSSPDCWPLARAQGTCRHSGDHRPGLDIPGHDGTGAHQGPFADRHAAEDHRPAADRRPTADPRRDHPPVRLRLEPPVGGRVGVEVVDEHHAVPYEDLVLDRYTLADEGVALDLAPRPDRGVLLDLDEGPDPALVADLATVEVNERVQDDVSAQPDVRRDPEEVGRIRPFVSRQTHWSRLLGIRWKGRPGRPGPGGCAWPLPGGGRRGGRAP